MCWAVYACLVKSFPVFRSLGYWAHLLHCLILRGTFLRVKRWLVCCQGVLSHVVKAVNGAEIAQWLERQTHD